MKYLSWLLWIALLFMSVGYASNHKQEGELVIQQMMYEMDDKLTEIIMKADKTLDEHTQIINLLTILIDECKAVLPANKLKQYEQMKRYSEAHIISSDLLDDIERK